MPLALKLRMPEALKRLLDSPRLAALFRPEYPPVAVEVTSRRLIAVAVARTPTAVSLERNRVIELPPGLVEPSLLRPAVSDPAAFAALLGQAVAGLPGFEGRFSLVLPDRVAKVTFVDLEKAAPTAAETAELIRWKLKRSTPFRVEDGRIAYQVFRANGAGLRCLVSLVQAEVVGQLEEIVASLGFETGLVDLSSFNLWNLLEGRLAGPGDALLLNVSEDNVTAIIARAGAPLFVRCKAPAGSEPLGLDEVRAELHPTLLYYQDRIDGPGIARAIVRAPEAMEGPLCATLAERYAVRAEPIELPPLAGTASVDRGRLALIAPALGAALGR